MEVAKRRAESEGLGLDTVSAFARVRAGGGGVVVVVVEEAGDGRDVRVALPRVDREGWSDAAALLVDQRLFPKLTVRSSVLLGVSCCFGSGRATIGIGAPLSFVSIFGEDGYLLPGVVVGTQALSHRNVKSKADGCAGSSRTSGALSMGERAANLLSGRSTDFVSPIQSSNSECGRGCRLTAIRPCGHQLFRCGCTRITSLAVQRRNGSEPYLPRTSASPTMYRMGRGSRWYGHVDFRIRSQVKAEENGLNGCVGQRSETLYFAREMHQRQVITIGEQGEGLGVGYSTRPAKR